MISDDAIAKHKQAGVIAQESLRAGAKLIREGVSMREVLDTVEDRIKKAGGGLAFPAQISLNSIAAHYCPTDEEDVIFKEGDLAKIDVGVHIDGYIADNAMSVSLGDHDDLLQASKDALHAALKIIRPSITLGEIGKTIQETIQSYGVQPIRNLSGHGLGHYKIHTPPTVPNIDSKDPSELVEGQVIAIEPFATNGRGAIYEGDHPTIFSFIQNRPTRSPFARQVLQTIKSFDGLPFTTRWLTRVHGVGKTRLALQELMRNGSIQSHPQLPEQGNGFVSQHEHSVIVMEKPLVFTKLE